MGKCKWCGDDTAGIMKYCHSCTKKYTEAYNDGIKDANCEGDENENK